MKIEELNQIINYLGVDNYLTMYCNRIGIKTDSVDTDEAYYNIVEQIEKNEELTSYFKEIAKTDKRTHVLIPYFTKTENIRFFIDNKKEYDLSEEIINNIEANFRKRYMNVQKENLDRQEKIYKHYDKYGIYYAISFLVICLLFTIDAVEPYFSTHITKKANITNAKIIEQNIHKPISDFYTTTIDIKYEYFVNGKEYIKEQDSVILGRNIIDVSINNKEEVEIYYYIDNPSKSKLYNKYNNFIKLDFICCDILLSIALIISIKRKIEYHKKVVKKSTHK